MQPRCNRLFLALFASALCAFAATAQDKLRIEKAKPVVEYKRFDPANLPDPPPPLGHGEAAVCEFSYQMNANGSYSYNGPPLPAEGGKLDVKIERIAIKLNLTVTIWLPKNAPIPLEAHEDGHRIIAEFYYTDADKIARALAAKVVGKKVSGEGKDTESAGQTAMNNACQKLLDDYLAAIKKPCDTAQIAFDRITAHGTNQKAAVKEAIDAAIKEAKGKQTR